MDLYQGGSMFIAPGAEGGVDRKMKNSSPPNKHVNLFDVSSSV
jgi:hypothetical protein